MASWEDEADDWETEADNLVAGVDLNAVDESKFADEEVAAEQPAWDEQVPTSQPKRAIENRYAARDARDAAAAARAASVDPNDPAAVKRAQEEAEMRMMAEQVGTSGGADGEAARLFELAELADSAKARQTKAEYEKLAEKVHEALGAPHEKGKQYKAYVKALAKLLCGSLDKDSVRDVETALAGLRSEKVKAELAASAQAKKGGKKNVKLERDDWDDGTYGGYGDADDDVDFM